jgi:hypothetical protein
MRRLRIWQSHDYIFCFNICKSRSQVDSPNVKALASIFGLSPSINDNLVGITCNPVSAIGVGPSFCSGSNVVCCNNNNFVSPFKVVWFTSRNTY